MYSARLGPKQDGMNAEVEERLRKDYPPLFENKTFLNQPTMIRDSHGKILVWYLPGMFSAGRQVSDSYTDRSIASLKQECS